MTLKNKNLRRDIQQSSNGSRLFPGQIITSEDLVDFKTDLIEEIKVIYKDLKDHGGKKWLRSRDVKDRLGISHGTLQNFRINGTLPYTKVGGVIFYDKDDINNMIESNRIDNAF